MLLHSSFTIYYILKISCYTIQFKNFVTYLLLQKVYIWVRVVEDLCMMRTGSTDHLPSERLAVDASPHPTLEAMSSSRRRNGVRCSECKAFSCACGIPSPLIVGISHDLLRAPPTRSDSV